MSRQRRETKERYEFIDHLADPAFYPAYVAALPETIYQHYRAEIPAEAKERYLQAYREIVEGVKVTMRDAVQSKLKKGDRAEVYIRFNPRAEDRKLKFNITQLEQIYRLTWEDNSTETVYSIDELAEAVNARNKRRDEEQEQIKRSGDKTRVASIMVEQGLLPRDKRHQPDLFTKEQAIRHDVEAFNYDGLGITYTTGEIKLVHALQTLYWEAVKEHEGQIKGKKDLTTRLGSEGVSVHYKADDTQRVDGTILKAPKIAFTIGELTRRYKGSNRVGGRDTQEVLQIMRELQTIEKMPRIAYEVTEKTEGRPTRRRTYFYHEPLVKRVDVLDETIDPDSEEVLNSSREVTVVLNPVFKHQIEGKYILRPARINELLKDANERVHGTRQTTLVLHLLHDELCHANSQTQKNTNNDRDENGNRVYTIGHKRLVDKVSGTTMGRPARTVEYLGKAFETLKEVGLILRVDTELGAGGRPNLYRFTLNKEY